MTLILADLIGETTTTTGTGALALGGAATGYRAFSTVCANGDTVPYVIGNPGDAQREVGLGTWNTGNTLARTVVFASSNGGAAVNLSAGTKPVYLVMPTELAGIVPSGATVPSLALEGNSFLHTPAGRAVLLQYAGGAWRPNASYGSMTLYVDRASGSDSVNKGYGTGANAYATLQYAIDSIPGTVGGNVSINIAAGTYTENVVIVGKNFTGNYNITLTGTRTTLDTLTSSASTQGSGATQGTVVRGSGTWTSNQRQNKMVRFTAGVNSGVTRIIDSNTTTTLTIVEIWPGGAPGTDAFVVEDWGTVIAPATGIAFTIGANQVNVQLTDLAVVGPAGFAGVTMLVGSTAAFGTTTVTVAAGATTFGVLTVAGQGLFDTCFLTNATEGDRIVACEGILKLDRTKVFANDASTLYAIVLQGGAGFKMQSGNVVDVNGGFYALELEASVMAAYTFNSHSKVRNASVAGIHAVFGSTAFYTTSGVYVDFSGNAADTSADAATYSSIT